MRYIAHKIDEDNHEIIHIKDMETVKGGMIEVVIGKNNVSKKKLGETIKSYKKETIQMKEARKLELEDMENMFKAMVISK